MKLTEFANRILEISEHYNKDHIDIFINTFTDEGIKGLSEIAVFGFNQETMKINATILYKKEAADRFILAPQGHRALMLSGFYLSEIEGVISDHRFIEAVLDWHYTQETLKEGMDGDGSWNRCRIEELREPLRRAKAIYEGEEE